MMNSARARKVSSRRNLAHFPPPAAPPVKLDLVAQGDDGALDSPGVGAWSHSRRIVSHATIFYRRPGRVRISQCRLHITLDP
jgi:hypothetical protein